MYLGRLCAGITVIGFQTSYALPILCRLLFVRGPLEGADSLGALSIPFAVISCVWLFGTSTLFFLPSSFPVAAATMNYACVVVGFFFIVAALYWLAWAHRTFAGPKRKHDTLMHITPDPEPGVELVTGKDLKGRTAADFDEIPQGPLSK